MNICVIKKLISKIIILGILFIVSSGINYSYGEIIPQGRVIAWNPGVPGGIPSRTTICANVKNSPYNAKGDNLTDDTAAIQRAIDNCPEGQVVYLPIGIYKITNMLTVTKGIVLRGEGPRSTKIKLYADANAIISIGDWPSTTKTSITSGSTKGSTTIMVSNSTNFSIGDFVLLDQLNDPTLVDIFGCTYCSRDNGTRALGQIVKITNKSGNNLTIDPPLYYNYSQSYSPEIIKISNNVVQYAGIEDLYLERVNLGGQDNIQIQNSAYCWVKNIESYNAYQRHIQLQTSFRCEVRDSYFHHAHAYGGGGQGYGVWLFEQSTANLIENNIFYHLRHSMIISAGGSGNVFGYNYSNLTYDEKYPNTVWLMADMVTHASHPYMNLWEGNRANNIGEDYTHGSASHSTYLRNYVDRGNNPLLTSHLVCADIQYSNRYINMVGNVFGKTGMSGSYEIENQTCNSYTSGVFKLGYTSDGDCTTSGNDSTVKSTLLRHGNYDFINNSIIWDPTISDHNIPNSYYLSSKPAFFGNIRWPIFGPELKPMVDTLPAEKRFTLIQSNPKLYLTP